MSQENVELVRALYPQLADRGEPPWEMFTADFEFDPSAVLPDVGVGRGRKAAEPVLRSYIDMFEDFHVELEAVLAFDDERVVTAVRDGGTLRGASGEIWNRFFHVFTIREAKIAGWSSHLDKAAALEAAGLSE